MAQNFLYEIFDDSLFQGKFGLERENIRTRESGFISQSSHPFEKDDNIGKDFCESQIEIASPVCSTIDELYNKVNLIDNKIRTRLKNMEEKEYIWAFSNPPYISNEYEIKVSRCSEYDEEGNAKEDVYKEYLAKKYDKRRMLYCGIHFNYSYSEKFVRLLFDASSESDYTKFKNDLYINLAKKVALNSWLLVYLTAASPIFDISLRSYGSYGETCFNGESSMRNGVKGYWNKSVLTVDYSSIDSYVSSLKKYVEDGVIYAESEWYTPVRIKPPGKNSLENLKKNGADHIELRMFDLNPLTKLGIYKQDLNFIHWFIIYLTLKQDVDFTADLQVKATENHKKSASFDCGNLYINTEGESVLLTEKALSILQDMEFLFKKLNREDICSTISQVKQRVLNPEIRYANQVYGKFKNDYVKKGVVLSKYYSM